MVDRQSMPLSKGGILVVYKYKKHIINTWEEVMWA